MNIFIFEGRRGTGKTTIMKMAAVELREVGFEVIPFKAVRGTDPTSDMLQTLLMFSRGARANPKRVYLVDRFHLTEFVMRYVDGTRKYEELMFETQMVQALITSVDAHVVVLDAPQDVIERRVTLRNDGRGPEAPTVTYHWKIYGPTFLRWPNVHDVRVDTMSGAHCFVSSLVGVVLDGKKLP